MKKQTTFSRDFLIGIAAQMQNDATDEFLAAAAAGDDRAFHAACRKGEAARILLREQQGHTMDEDIARAMGIDFKADRKTG